MNFLIIKKGKKYICQFGTDYTCRKCNKHVYYRQIAALCTGCNQITHQKFAGLNNL